MANTTPSPTLAPTKVAKAKKPKTCKVSENFPDSIRQWCDLIQKWADKRDIDPNLIAAVMLQESGGDEKSYSFQGAVGLLQVMPRDGLAAGFGVFGNRPSMDELFDPDYNLEYGSGMLAGLFEKYGNWQDALYHYGPTGMGYGYADKILAIYEGYK